MIERKLGIKPIFYIGSYKNYAYGFNYNLSSPLFPRLSSYQKSEVIANDKVKLLKESDKLDYSNTNKIYLSIERHLSTGEDFLLDGYWANESFFEDDEPYIRSFLKPAAIDIPQSVQCNESIGVHVRRHEYGHVGLASLSYYKFAISAIRDAMGPLKVNVFTDEPNFCRYVFSKTEGVSVSTGDTKSPLQDFIALMYHRHFVLSNSSFSFWAAFFGEQSDSRVFFPHPFCVDMPHTILGKRLTKWAVIDGAVTPP